MKWVFKKVNWKKIIEIIDKKCSNNSETLSSLEQNGQASTSKKKKIK